MDSTPESGFKWNFTPEERRGFAQILLTFGFKKRDGLITVEDLMKDRNLTPEHRPVMEALFRQFDVNKDGKWDLEELVAYMEKQGL
ncbi:hypothetical protein FGIG_12285 [Fasciola gigantica]|uniref:EF-hand domain-containing protein n=1 Tax=Fasciola gigantica TaxID=46835 RepID=A0A504Z6A8_FASGI|nr:hypothetical protein FGIG_12285 [Fasciola gigantica]